MGVLIGILVTFLWATSVILIRIGVSDEDVDPIGFAGTRFFLAAMLLLPLSVPGIRAAPTWHRSGRWLAGVAEVQERVERWLDGGPRCGARARPGRSGRRPMDTRGAG